MVARLSWFLGLELSVGPPVDGHQARDQTSASWRRRSAGGHALFAAASATSWSRSCTNDGPGCGLRVVRLCAARPAHRPCAVRRFPAGKATAGAGGESGGYGRGLDDFWVELPADAVRGGGGCRKSWACVVVTLDCTRPCIGGGGRRRSPKSGASGVRCSCCGHWQAARLLADDPAWRGSIMQLGIDPDAADELTKVCTRLERSAPARALPPTPHFSARGTILRGHEHQDMILATATATRSPS